MLIDLDSSAALIDWNRFDVRDGDVRNF